MGRHSDLDASTAKAIHEEHQASHEKAPHCCSIVLDETHCARTPRPPLTALTDFAASCWEHTPALVSHGCNPLEIKHKTAAGTLYRTRTYQEHLALRPPCPRNGCCQAHQRNHSAATTTQQVYLVGPDQRCKSAYTHSVNQSTSTPVNQARIRATPLLPSSMIILPDKPHLTLATSTCCQHERTHLPCGAPPRAPRETVAAAGLGSIHPSDRPLCPFAANTVF